MTLDLPAARLLGFNDVLRGAGFAASTDQGISYLKAVSALGPRDFGDLRRAAFAIFGPSPERRGEFEALFEQYFLDRFDVAQVTEDADAPPPRPDGSEIVEEDEADPRDTPGQTASGDAVLSTRALAPDTIDTALRRFARLAPHYLPERMTRRKQAARRGPFADRARALREATRLGGEILELPKLRRRRRLRPILLLIDISGSMKDQTENALRVAHVLTRLPTRVEVFSLGTNLTRITPALKLRSEAQALQRVTDMVADFDGGTRLGDTMSQLLKIPRFSGFARGAIVVTLSDGLEIGDSNQLVAAVRKMGRLAFAHLWLTPLSGGRDFTPQTDALIRIAPFIDEFGSAKSIPHICAHLLGEQQLGEAA